LSVRAALARVDRGAFGDARPGKSERYAGLDRERLLSPLVAHELDTL